MRVRGASRVDQVVASAALGSEGWASKAYLGEGRVGSVLERLKVWISWSWSWRGSSGVNACGCVS